MTATLTTFELGVEMRRFVADADAVDPADLAEQFVTVVPEEELRSVLASALRHSFRELLRDSRRVTPDANGSGKWAMVRDALDEGLLPWQRWAVYCGDEGWKRLPDCTAGDLATVADGYRRREAEQARWAARYAGLHVLLSRARGARTVGDLEPSRVSAVLRDDA